MVSFKVTIRLKHLGMFTVKKNRFKYYKNGRKKKQKKKPRQEQY